MKKIIVILLLALMPLLGVGQSIILNAIDTTTLSTNTLFSGGLEWLTNIATSEVISNTYLAVRTNVTQIGESQASANVKINGNFAALTSYFTTNNGIVYTNEGPVVNGNVPIMTNSGHASGYYWGALSLTGGPFISQNSGISTNLSLFGLTTFDSVLQVYDGTNGLIPPMTDNVTPGGQASASDTATGSQPYLAFENYVYIPRYFSVTKWLSSGTNQQPWIEYAFPASVTIYSIQGAFGADVSGTLMVSGATATLQISTNGSLWTSLETKGNSSFTAFTNFDNAAFPIGANYIRVVYNDTNSGVVNLAQFQVFGKYPNSTVFNSTSNQFTVVATNGTSFVGPVNIWGPFTVNGLPVQGGTTYTNNKTGVGLVTGSGIGTNTQSLLQATNGNGQNLTISGNTLLPLQYTVSTALLITNIVDFIVTGNFDSNNINGKYYWNNGVGFSFGSWNAGGFTNTLGSSLVSDGAHWYLVLSGLSPSMTNSAGVNVISAWTGNILGITPVTGMSSYYVTNVFNLLTNGGAIVANGSNPNGNQAEVVGNLDANSISISNIPITSVIGGTLGYTFNTNQVVVSVSNPQYSYLAGTNIWAGNSTYTNISGKSVVVGPGFVNAWTAVDNFIGTFSVFLVCSNTSQLTNQTMIPQDTNIFSIPAYPGTGFPSTYYQFATNNLAYPLNGWEPNPANYSATVSFPFVPPPPIGGVTTNIQFVDGSVLLGVFLPTATNTLYFTNGLLMRVSSP